jgi:hypothetical protein
MGPHRPFWVHDQLKLERTSVYVKGTVGASRPGAEYEEIAMGIVTA